jgi:hypothetical protein
MRSQVLRRSRSLLKGSASYSAPPPGRPFRIPQSPLRIPVGIRFSSSVAHDESSQGVVQPEPSNTETSPGELERPKRRTKSSTTSSKELDPLPSELDILWTADTVRPDPLDSSVLPPPEIFENVLNNLHIILHPQTQHRAIYTSPAGPPIEPTLALICPIEGGDYVVDATVRELAHRTNSEVVVLDAVQLAAGEWGAFGNGKLLLFFSNDNLGQATDTMQLQTLFSFREIPSISFHRHLHLFWPMTIMKEMRHPR